MEQPGEGFGVCGALASRLIRLKGGLGGGARIVGLLDMDEEADQDESDQEELVQQQVRRHDDVPSHDNERRRLYRMHPVTNYPFVAGTPPIVCATSRTGLAPASKGGLQHAMRRLRRVRRGAADQTAPAACDEMSCQVTAFRARSWHRVTVAGPSGRSARGDRATACGRGRGAPQPRSADRSRAHDATPPRYGLGNPSNPIARAGQARSG